MNNIEKLRQEYRNKVGSTYNMKYEWYADWLETELLKLRLEVKKNVAKRNVMGRSELLKGLLDFADKRFLDSEYKHELIVNEYLKTL